MAKEKGTFSKKPQKAGGPSAAEPARPTQPDISGRAQPLVDFGGMPDLSGLKEGDRWSVTRTNGQTVNYEIPEGNGNKSVDISVVGADGGLLGSMRAAMNERGGGFQEWVDVKDGPSIYVGQDTTYSNPYAGIYNQGTPTTGAPDSAKAYLPDFQHAFPLIENGEVVGQLGVVPSPDGHPDVYQNVYQDKYGNLSYWRNRSTESGGMVGWQTGEINSDGAGWRILPTGTLGSPQRWEIPADSPLMYRTEESSVGVHMQTLDPSTGAYSDRFSSKISPEKGYFTFRDPRGTTTRVGDDGSLVVVDSKGEILTHRPAPERVYPDNRSNWEKTWDYMGNSAESVIDGTRSLLGQNSKTYGGSNLSPEEAKRLNQKDALAGMAGMSLALSAGLALMAIDGYEGTFGGGLNDNAAYTPKDNVLGTLNIPSQLAIGADWENYNQQPGQTISDAVLGTALLFLPKLPRAPKEIPKLPKDFFPGSGDGGMPSFPKDAVPAGLPADSPALWEKPWTNEWSHAPSGPRSLPTPAMDPGSGTPTPRRQVPATPEGAGPHGDSTPTDTRRGLGIPIPLPGQGTTGPDANRSYGPGSAPWAHNPTGSAPTIPAPGTSAPTDPHSPPVTRPNPADDPNTSHQRVMFPSTKPGQLPVPVEGTFWDGNGILRNGTGNPRGQQPGTIAPKSSISLKADLFWLKQWSGKLEDVDEKYRPILAAHIGHVADTQAFQDRHRDTVALLASPSGANIAELLGGSSRLRAELDRIEAVGLDSEPLKSAVAAYWQAQAPIDTAKELLGQAGAIAVLRSDGWEVNVRPKGGNKHDIVAFKDGMLMIVEAKGGNPGNPKVGDALIPDGAYQAQQMTDPYLWHKLEQDAAKDPVFTQWLIDRGMWDAVQNEDPTKIGYRLIRTDTNGKIDIYGSTQEKIGDAVPPDTEIGKTTGNKPGAPPEEQNPGPTLHGVAQPLPTPVFDSAPVNPLKGLLNRARDWLGDLARGHLHDTAALSQLAVEVPAVPTLQPGLWPQRTPTDQSLTVTITTPKRADQAISEAERLKCFTYL
ncbi:hypothetical protein [Nocardia sp. R6R-6]|uniref:hypothetical protein n=1 Tax=Nocardia sp. R6R-6 TaxID=3459303 RepID=UPI00403DEE2B